jgi:transposase
VTSYHLSSVGKYNYVLASESYWDKDEKKSKNHKNSIGKIQKNTNKIIFKPKFLRTYNEKTIKIEGQIIEIDNPYIKSKKLKDIPSNDLLENNVDNTKDLSIHLDNIDTILKVFDTYKKYGLKYLFDNILKITNLEQILKRSIPKYYDQIITIVYYIISEHQPMMYCNYWAEENGINDFHLYSSQNISKIFDSITPKNRDDFYRNWLKATRENEFLAIDITSISSWSNTIDMLEFGYNRDHEELKQINICTLFGQKSYLPMYQTEFNGSINDVNTLKTIISEFYALIGDHNFTLVMDKGFYSLGNIDFMLTKNEIKFIISVPLTNNYAIKSIDLFSQEPKTYSSFIYNTMSNDKIFGKRIPVSYLDNKMILSSEINGLHSVNAKCLFAYVYYNPCNEIKERNNLFDNLAIAKNNILQHNKIGKFKQISDKYFNIIYSDDKKKIINIEVLENKIEDKLKHCGYFVLLSNIDYDKDDIYKLYRKRNVVEQAFNNYKNHLGLDRFHVHGDRRMVNKSFLYFISLILYSFIYKKMLDNSLFSSKMTITTVLREFSKMQSFEVKNNRYLRPLSAIQKQLLNAFGIKIPSTL